MKITQLVTGPLSVNTWFIESEDRRAVVVDPGGDAPEIIAHLAGRRLEPTLFFLTHGHFDHLIALPELARRWPDVPVAIHPGDSDALGSGAIERHRAIFEELGAAGLVDRNRDELPAASILLEDGKEVILPGGLSALPGWTVIHTPGHSPGSVCLYSAVDATLIAGDTLFSAGYGRTDIEGGSVEALFASLNRLFALPRETVVLPGHGRKTTIGAEIGSY